MPRAISVQPGLKKQLTSGHVVRVIDAGARAARTAHPGQATIIELRLKTGTAGPGGMLPRFLEPADCWGSPRGA